MQQTLSLMRSLWRSCLVASVSFSLAAMSVSMRVAQSRASSRSQPCTFTEHAKAACTEQSAAVTDIAMHQPSHHRESVSKSYASCVECVCSEANAKGLDCRCLAGKVSACWNQQLPFCNSILMASCTSCQHSHIQSMKEQRSNRAHTSCTCWSISSCSVRAAIWSCRSSRLSAFRRRMHWLAAVTWASRYRARLLPPTATDFCCAFSSASACPARFTCTAQAVCS